MSLKNLFYSQFFKNFDKRFMKHPKSNRRRVSNKSVGGWKKFKNILAYPYGN